MSSAPSSFTIAASSGMDVLALFAKCVMCFANLYQPSSGTVSSQVTLDVTV